MWPDRVVVGVAVLGGVAGAACPPAGPELHTIGGDTQPHRYGETKRPGVETHSGHTAQVQEDWQGDTYPWETLRGS